MPLQPIQLCLLSGQQSSRHAIWWKGLHLTHTSPQHNHAGHRCVDGRCVLMEANNGWC